MRGEGVEANAEPSNSYIEGNSLVSESLVRIEVDALKVIWEERDTRHESIGWRKKKSLV
jgi:hypothetical protein